MKEIWKDIDDYEDCYMVSNLGRVKSKNRTIKRKSDNYLIKINEKFKKLTVDSHGYHCVILSKNNKSKLFRVHRLVTSAFLGKSNLFVNHKNGIKTDNKISNLEYLSNRDNIKHAYENGLMKKQKSGLESKLTKLNFLQILTIKTMPTYTKHTKNKHSWMTKDIAKHYNVSVAVITRIRNNKKPYEFLGKIF